MRPPVFVRLKVTEHGKKKASLWLPVFLLWPLALLLLPLIPLLLLVGLILSFTAKGRLALGAGLALASLPFCLSGLEIDVEEPEKRSKVFIKII
jgi:uncharacterized membrane protein